MKRPQTASPRQSPFMTVLRRAARRNLLFEALHARYCLAASFAIDDTQVAQSAEMLKIGHKTLALKFLEVTQPSGFEGVVDEEFKFHSEETEFPEIDQIEIDDLMDGGVHDSKEEVLFDEFDDWLQTPSIEENPDLESPPRSLVNESGENGAVFELGRMDVAESGQAAEENVDGEAFVDEAIGVSGSEVTNLPATSATEADAANIGVPSNVSLTSASREGDSLNQVSSLAGSARSDNEQHRMAFMTSVSSGVVTVNALVMPELGISTAKPEEQRLVLRDSGPIQRVMRQPISNKSPARPQTQVLKLPRTDQREVVALKAAVPSLKFQLTCATVATLSMDKPSSLAAEGNSKTQVSEVSGPGLDPRQLPHAGPSKENADGEVGISDNEGTSSIMFELSNTILSHPGIQAVGVMLVSTTGLLSMTELHPRQDRTSNEFINFTVTRRGRVNPKD